MGVPPPKTGETLGISTESADQRALTDAQHASWKAVPWLSSQLVAGGIRNLARSGEFRRVSRATVSCYSCLQRHAALLMPLDTRGEPPIPLHTSGDACLPL